MSVRRIGSTSVITKESRGNAGAVESVESQHQAFPSSHEPLGNRYRDSHIPAAPTTNSFYILISVDGCRSLRPLSPRQRRFAPTVIGFAPESLIGFISESLIDFAGIPSAIGRQGRRWLDSGEGHKIPLGGY
jgi:hypothetical protein